MGELSAEDEKLAPWQRQQKKTFTNWVNLHLRTYGLEITELRNGFEDGLKLMKLIEAISKESCGKPDKVKMRIHKIQNLNKALANIEQCGVRLIGISSEEICDGNLKMILGMIWTLILRFQIQDISMEQMSAKDGLLLWCQKKTRDYDNVNVQNFHMSFKDGLAFCALIHKHRPDLIDYASLSKSDPLTNLNTAFQVMEKEYDIPQLLDAQDIVDMPKPDEMSVMAYVSLYYHAFQSGKQNENAARRIANLLAQQREIEKLKQEYESLITDLLEWIAAQRVIRQDRTSCQSVAEVQQRLGDVSTYRKTEKTQRGKEKNHLEDHYRALQNKLRLANRPAYHPPEGRHVADVNAEWKALEADEAGYDKFLRDELVRLQQLEDLYQSFVLKAGSAEKWAEGKDAKASSEDYGDSFTAVIVAKQQHEAFVTQLQARSSRAGALQEIVTQLEDLGFNEMDSARTRFSEIQKVFEDLLAQCEVRSQKLDEQEQLMKRLDEMRLAFAKAADEVAGNIEALTEDVSANVRVHSLAEAEELPKSQEAFVQKVDEVRGSVDALQASQDGLDAEGITDNVYAAYTVDEVRALLAELEGAVAHREEAVTAEAERQQQAEALRIVFADAANPFVAFIDEVREGLVADVSQGSLEDQKAAIEARNESLAAKEAEFETVSEANAALEDALVFSNDHTTVTMEGLAHDWAAVKNQVSKALSENSNAIEQRDALGVTDEEIAELKKTFEHFDKDGSGALDRLEFRSCLMASEVDLPTLNNADDADPKFDAIMTECANEEQVVNLPDFINYMSKQNKDKESPEQLIESLRVLSGDKDVITRAQMSSDLSSEDVDYLISQMTPTDNADEYDYSGFVASIFGQQ